jgi:hypothetical protein
VSHQLDLLASLPGAGETYRDSDGRLWRRGVKKLGLDGKPRPVYDMPVLAPAEPRNIDKEHRAMQDKEARRRASRQAKGPRTSRELAHDKAADAGEAEPREENEDEQS